MRAVIQRVSEASVTIDGERHAEIGRGFLVLLGVMAGDDRSQADFLARKLVGLRVFTDAKDKMNLSVTDVDGEILIISQFTLAADCAHGRRPSFTQAAKPQQAVPLYEYFVSQVAELTAKEVKTGVFGADMQVSLVNDGPVTILFDSEQMMKK